MMKREVNRLALFPIRIMRVSFLSPMFLLTTYLLFPDVPAQYTIAGWHMQTDEAQEATHPSCPSSRGIRHAR